MKEKYRQAEREVQRLYDRNLAILFGACAAFAVLGLLAMEPGVVILGILMASVVGHIAQKRDHRWRDTSEPETEDVETSDVERPDVAEAT